MKEEALARWHEIAPPPARSSFDALICANANLDAFIPASLQLHALAILN